MHPTPTAKIVPSPSRALLFLGLIAGGLAGNYFKYPIFLNIDFLFGSIFALLALQFFGLARGVAAACIIAGYTYIIWNHPYAIIIMTAEVLFVGWLMQRRKASMVLADTLFWLFIGMPLVYLFYHLVMDVPPSNTYIVMTKQAVNGIANALTGRLLFTVFALHSRSSLISLSDIVYNLLAFFVLFPALIMLAISCRSDFNQTDRTIRTNLAYTSGDVADHLETWLLNRRTSLANLAELAVSKSPREMQALIDQVKKSDVNYLKIGLADKAAVSIASSPLLDNMGRSTIGVSFAEHPSVLFLQEKRQTMLSELVSSEYGFHNPTVLVLEPVLIAGKYAGHVYGALNLEQIWKHLDYEFDRIAMLYTLVDKNNNVISTNHSDQKIMSPFVRDKGTLHRLDNGISQWVPVVPHNTPISERWKQSMYVTELAIGDLAEWQLILEQPIALFQKTLYDNYTRKLTLLFLILLGSLALAELLSRRAIATLEKLYLITRDLPVKLTTGGEEIVWPESTIKETHHLIKNFQDMGGSLSGQFVKIHQINESLRQRMEELKASEERFAGMFRRHSAMMLLLEPETGAIVDANLAAENFYKYSRTTLLNMNIADINTFSGDDCKDILQKVRLGQKNFFVAEHKDAEGAIHTVEVHSTLIPVQDSAKLFSIINDISERKRIGKENARLEAKNRQLQKAESLGVMAGAIAHHFNNQLAVVIGNLEMALDDLQFGLTPGKDLNNALLAAQKAAEISGQMVTYLGQGTDSRKPLDLSAFCRQSLPLLQAAAPKNLLLALDLPAAAPVINASAHQIRQLLTNLVTNAWETTHAAHGTIDLAVKTVSPEAISATHRFPIGRQAEDPAYGCLSVTDTGAGIASDDIDKLFDPFFSSKFSGRGLGLSVVLGIVKGHGGLITVESEEGQGSTFRVFFPISAEGIAPQTHTAASPAATETGGTVLLIDDEEMMRTVAETMLKCLGFKVFSAKDGVEALEVYQNHSDEIDVVLSDLTMPRMNGWETMAALRQIQPALPVILSSGHDESKVIDAERSELPQAFLHKPYRLEDMRDTLAKVLGSLVC